LDNLLLLIFYRSITIEREKESERLPVMYYGLVMAWEFGITELWCYSDSKTAIKFIFEPLNNWHHYATILYNIKELLVETSGFDWFTLQEDNTCTNYLAKLGACTLEAYSPIIVPPNGISLLLLDDASGAYFSRYFSFGLIIVFVPYFHLFMDLVLYFKI